MWRGENVLYDFQWLRSKMTPGHHDSALQWQSVLFTTDLPNTLSRMPAQKQEPLNTMNNTHTSF